MPHSIISSERALNSQTCRRFRQRGDMKQTTQRKARARPPPAPPAAAASSLSHISLARALSAKPSMTSAFLLLLLPHDPSTRSPHSSPLDPTTRPTQPNPNPPSLLAFDKTRRQQTPTNRGRFATLPEEARARYEHPASVFSFGWSHGKETLEAGRPDLAKGSFYANPCFDAPFGEGKSAAAAAAAAAEAGGGEAGGETAAEAAAKAEADPVARYPSFAHPNVWPDADVPGFSGAFKELGRAVVRVGELVARQCDRCSGGRGDAGGEVCLLDLIATGRGARSGRRREQCCWCRGARNGLGRRR